MRFYLAHPLIIRDRVRKFELGFEERTGHELVNPFYDVEGKEGDTIKIWDAGEKELWVGDMDEFKIVIGDAMAILDPKTDGVVMIVDFVQSIGTFQEQIIARFGHLIRMLRKVGACYNIPDGILDIFDKPVYVVCFYKPWLNHPWLKFFATEIVGSFEELEYLLGCA